MAIGDQVHWLGSSPTTIRPSSGVEVILKECNTSTTGSNSFTYAYHRHSANTYSNVIVAGGAYSAYQDKPSANQSGSSKNGMMTSIPINYTYYLNTYYQGSYTGHKFAGYITKE